MSLLFTQLCDLLSALEDISTRDPPFLPDRVTHKYKEILKSWFASYKISIHSLVAEPVALLSALFPEKRTDRVYNIQCPRLTRSLRRYLSLGDGRWQLLDQWQTAGRGGLGVCVERVLQQAEHPTTFGVNRVTLEDVDRVLASVASRCRFSGPKVYLAGQDSDNRTDDDLANIYRRLQSREAKWFTRLILKDFATIELGNQLSLIYSCIDARLPVAMQMYDKFEDAVAELKGLPASQMASLNHHELTQRCTDDAHLLQPKIGVKVGPPKWVKAKGGVKHAVRVTDGRTMSIERKHDGEYCQIHVDLSKGDDCLQIFSKSGKDSTEDRIGVHQAIKDGLRIGCDDCKLSDKCILEGELLVWSERTKGILDFHKIRKHVSRSGSFLGTTLDSQPHPWEHLMIVFYDVLLVDDDAVLHRPFKYRRQVLEGLVTPISGKVELVTQKTVSFSNPNGPKLLVKYLAQAFVRRWEGLVLKPSDDPYLNLQRQPKSKYSSRWIKLKKDCIKGLGDTADFAVVGAGYDASHGARLRIPNLRWTHFFIGCLQNKRAVLQSNEIPQFMICDCVTDCIKTDDLKTLNQRGQFMSMLIEDPEVPAIFSLETLCMDTRLPKMSVIFKQPFVFDIAGSGFDMGPDRDLFTLRFPRVMKVHWGRDWRQTVSLDELQAMATNARKAPLDNSQEEIADWVEKLTEADHGAKGQLNSWDNSDDDCESEDEIAEMRLTVAASKASHRIRTPAALPFIRMDTGEIAPNERRGSNGEVTERPSSNHSTASLASGASLPTPPSSSPVRGGDHNGTREPLMSPPFQRKRSAHDVGRQHITRSPKRARSGYLHRSTSEIKPTGELQASKQTKALQEIRNSARPPLLTRSATLPEKKTPSPSDTFLVRKIPIGANEHVHRRRHKRPIIVESSPPEQHTTTDDCTTSAETTQQSSHHPTQILKPQPSPTRIPTNSSYMPTPPATANPPPPNPRTTIAIPNLQTYQILLSPSLSNPICPPSSHALLAGLPPSPTTLPLKTACPQKLSESPILAQNKDIILLLDLAKESAETDDLMDLVRQAKSWYPRSVLLFDWRLLEVLIWPWVDEGVKREMVGREFAGRVFWVGGGGVGGGEGKRDGIGDVGGLGEVRVEWADGGITVVEGEVLRKLVGGRGDE